MKTDNSFFHLNEIVMPRRQFVKGVAMGGALLGLGISPGRLFAGTDPFWGQSTLRGKRFNLSLAPQAVNFTGSDFLSSGSSIQQFLCSMSAKLLGSCFADFMSMINVVL